MNAADAIERRIRTELKRWDFYAPDAKVKWLAKILASEGAKYGDLDIMCASVGLAVGHGASVVAQIQPK